MSKTCSLDVAFATEATTHRPEEPMAMAYGWAVKENGGWRGVGQRPGAAPEKAATGDLMNFTAFSIDPSVRQIGRVEVSFERIDGNRQAPRSPFDSSSYSMTKVDSESISDSAGCNVVGPRFALWEEPLEIKNHGRFECTVVIVCDGKKFEIDPELEVQQGGGP